MMKKKITKVKKLKKRVYQMSEEALNLAIKKLIEKAGISPDSRFIEEMIVTALKLQEDALERGDIKMINASMKELRYGLKVFYPYQHVRKVAIFGSARTKPSAPDYRQAKEFAELITKEGWMVMTGAAAGIMQAGNEGAGRLNSFGVNIRLPFEQQANPIILDDPKLVNFKYFFTRKLIFVRESDATVLCPGGFGTHDEGFETLTLVQTGKATPRPIICLDPSGSTYWKTWKAFILKELGKRGMIDPEDIELIDFTHSPSEAVKMIVDFYRNYHSSRYIRDSFIIRIHKPLDRKQLEKINDKFSSIVKKGKITQVHKPFEEESNEPRTFDLARLVFSFDRKHHAKLHLLIRELNRCAGE